MALKIADIKRRIADATSITNLNAMQQSVAATAAPNLVLLAPTGSGKTLAFTIALMRRLDPAFAGKGVSCVVIAPSRELVMQIHSVVRPVAAGFKTVAFYGGNAFSAEQSSIEGSVPDIVIATPGRLLDHINRGTLNVATARTLVVDEYDKTLELGFHDEIRRIVRRLTKVNATILTSATPIAELPSFIDAAKAQVLDFSFNDSPASRIVTMNVPSPEKDKINTLEALLRSINAQSAMIFVNHRESAERVASELEKRNIDCTLYHGGLDQREREIAVAKFSLGATNVLVSTDLAARGLDIADVQAVVHYHMPTSEQAWTHRNGRTARAGASGEIYVITAPEENVPDYVATDNDYYPDYDAKTSLSTQKRLLYINAGRRDKISRGDVAGFVMKQCAVSPDKVGKISIGLDYALVAVDADVVNTVIEAARSARLKNKRVRISLA
jgi:superfamily II DNA/RNA helicase